MQADDRIPTMTWRARPDLSCEFASPAWLEYTGCTLEQALGEGWTRAVHPDDLTRWRDTCRRAADQRMPFEIEYRLRRRDGEYRWVLDRAAPQYADQDFLGYAGACTDIEDLLATVARLVQPVGM
jgi:two-component system, LuxR family, sensor kinase FixL